MNVTSRKAISFKKKKKFNGSKKCRICSFVKSHLNLNDERKGSGWIWRDDKGRRWHGSICPDCIPIHSKSWESYQNNLKFGTIDDVEYAPIKLGREAERLVEWYFSMKGWKTKLTTQRGTDLIIFNEHTSFSIEVKKVSGRYGHWFVSPVARSCLKNDLIVIVLPCGHLAVSSMSGHIAKCSTKGYRGVTREVSNCANCLVSRSEITLQNVFNGNEFQIEAYKP